jgi:uncharacterized protein
VPVNTLSNRLGLFAALAEATRGNLGRTALMKLCYFLQALRGLPLGYKFTLYSYGPFDSDVLADLQTAENMGVLRAGVDYYPGGYKYDIQPDEKSATAKALARDFLAQYKQDIDWVARTFGGRNSPDLELLSTIVYVHQHRGISDPEDLTDQVKSVKPHFNVAQIRQQVEWLAINGLLN